jgi:putative transposon-encoded protein
MAIKCTNIAVKYLLYSCFLHYIMLPSMRVEVRAYQVIEKIVKASGTSGRVYVPPEWIGKRVKILLLEPLEQDK